MVRPITSLVLTEPELRQAVDLTLEGVDAIAEGFAMLARGRVHQPSILRVDVPEHRGEVDVKSAYVVGWDSFAVKVSTGFFGNPTLGLPTGLGLMVLLSAETGATEALLLDNGYLTSIRTALAGAVAARALAPESAAVAGVLGAGDQARWQLRALTLVRDLQQVRVWARRRDEADRYAQEMGAELGLGVRVVASPRSVVEAADIVVSTTPAREPIVEAPWLHPGLHITAMGSDAETKQELTAGAVITADVFACDRIDQSRRLGELRAVDESGAAPEFAPVELGSIISGDHPGRIADDQLTICDLTGTGVQDTVIARIAVERCREAGLGQAITSGAS